jgi:hypothetical protein
VVLKVSKDQQVPKENRVFKDHKDLRVFKVFRVKKAHKAMLALLDQPVKKANKEAPENQVPQGQKAIQAIPVFILVVKHLLMMLTFGLTQKVK